MKPSNKLLMCAGYYMLKPRNVVPACSKGESTVKAGYPIKMFGYDNEEDAG